ncbi:MAG: 7TM domain-containing protein [Planctomycetota bacterium]|jgi:hypothetical protein
MQMRLRNNLSVRQKWVLALILAAPLALALVKLSPLPGSAFLAGKLSLERLPEEMHSRLRYILLVPFGAMLVVFVRLTLGIRVLGPFRSILLAIAFHITGIGVGLAFVGIVVGVIVALRPVLKGIRLPYFGRVSVILSAVALIFVLAILLSVWLGHAWLRSVAYFPIVVLCLAGEGFARTLAKEGMRSALWRGGATVLLAVLIALISGTGTFGQILSRHPELLISQIACVIVISEYLNWRLLEGLNPKPVKRKRTSKRRLRPPGPTQAAGRAAGHGPREMAGARSAEE